MTPEQLEALSREAAGCLPGNIFDVWPIFDEEERGIIYTNEGARWLHESTEACAEIMVRVLWPADTDITGGRTTKGIWGAGWSGIKAGEFVYEEDPMLAYRVAVLRALIALKGKP